MTEEQEESLILGVRIGGYAPYIGLYFQIQRMIAKKAKIAFPSNDSNANKTEQQSVVKLIFLQTQQAMLIVCIPNIVIIHERKMHVFLTIYVFK